MTFDDLDLDWVALIPDFAVELREMDDAGYLVHFVSPSRGELAWFPGWEHADRDLRHFTPADVPIGTLDEPFEDRDDGWRIVIFERAGFVYVFEGDSPKAAHLPRRFRVPLDRYLAAWAVLMLRFNAPVPLDES